MSSSAVTTSVAAISAAPSRRADGVLLPRLVAGLVILALWEATVRAFAPPYVAKPSGVALALPRVIVDPAFLRAALDTLVAVGEGLAIAIVVGTLIGLLIGRSTVGDRALAHYVNGFNALPMIVILPLVTL